MIEGVEVRRPLGDNAPSAKLYYGADCRETLRGLPEQSVHTVVTSPPYWGLRDYGTGDAQIGLEDNPDEFVAQLVEVFREVRRVLRDDGTCWLNLGDSYAGSRRGDQGETGDRKNREAHSSSLRQEVPSTMKPKDLAGIPWMVALALRADGWYLRSDIIWAKGSCMPESVTDRPTRSHEYLFLLTKQPRYFYDYHAIKEPQVFGDKDRQKHGKRNKRTVWNVNPRPYPGAHFAVFPPELVTPCVLAGTSERGCCSECGAAWERVVERPTKPVERDDVRPSDRDGGMTVEQGWERSGMSHFKYNEWLKENPARTTGWKPTCACDSGEPVPCTVLDPFSGSATTGLVALDHGRDYVGIDLNAEYRELAVARLLGERPPSDKDNESGGILDFLGVQDR